MGGALNKIGRKHKSHRKYEIRHIKSSRRSIKRLTYKKLVTKRAVKNSRKRVLKRL